MRQFDESTDTKGEEAAKKYARELGIFPKGTIASVNGHTRGWDDAWAATKFSLEILTRAVKHADAELNNVIGAISSACGQRPAWTDLHKTTLIYETMVKAGYARDAMEAAIAAVKARGDWPLEEK